ncbi:hypothetical protein INT44_007703 [Umbelopsis vinacea]|uniref:Uncharacterized protein n=1 Tax=Umbelopsis vinacea TaxID=44442 RepID=A0A8H7PK69_9FUNG|nr:hypothetical protein INT44_007703 [Umbelopsis vinacea]
MSWLLALVFKDSAIKDHYSVDSNAIRHWRLFGQFQPSDDVSLLCVTTACSSNHVQEAQWKIKFNCESANHEVAGETNERIQVKILGIGNTTHWSKCLVASNRVITSAHAPLKYFKVILAIGKWVCTKQVCHNRGSVYSERAYYITMSTQSSPRTQIFTVLPSSSIAVSSSSRFTTPLSACDVEAAGSDPLPSAAVLALMAISSPSSRSYQDLSSQWKLQQRFKCCMVNVGLEPNVPRPAYCAVWLWFGIGFKYK